MRLGARHLPQKSALSQEHIPDMEPPMDVHAIVFALAGTGKTLLTEIRSDIGPWGRRPSYPGGKPSLEDRIPEDTLFREMQEELGCRPLEFEKLKREPAPDPTPSSKLVQPFLVFTWEGTLPLRTLDHGTPLLWVPARTLAETSPAEVVRSIARQFLDRDTP